MKVKSLIALAMFVLATAMPASAGDQCQVVRDVTGHCAGLPDAPGQELCDFAEYVKRVLGMVTPDSTFPCVG